MLCSACYEGVCDALQAVLWLLSFLLCCSLYCLLWTPLQPLLQAMSATPVTFHYLLQAILVALETPRSHRGLQALAKHSKPLAAALLGFLDGTVYVQHTQGKAPERESAQDTAATSLQAALGSFGQHASATRLNASDRLDGQTNTVSQPQQQQQQVAAQVASISTAHRCLESMLAREAVFSLPAAVVAQALHSPAVVFSTVPTSMSSGNNIHYIDPPSSIEFTTVLKSSTTR